MNPPPQRVALLFLVMLAACQPVGDGPPPPADGGPSDACPAGSHAASSGSCESTVTVTRSARVITPARDHHVSFVFESSDGPYLYVVGGGADGLDTLFDDIQRAPIATDGSLGSFAEVGRLREPRAGHAAVLLDGQLIVTGGLALVPGGHASTASTLVADMHEDGTLDAWQEGPPLPLAVMHHTCDAEGARIFCVGGRIPGNFTALMSVQAEKSDDGTLSPFRPWVPLPASVGFHQAFMHDNALYIAGGLHRDAPDADFVRLRDVLRSDLNADIDDAVPEAWQPAGALPAPLSVASAQPLLGRVYFAGGMDGDDNVLDHMTVASLVGGKVVDAETVPAALSLPRMHVHQTPAYGRWMYSVGGRDSTGAAVGTIDIIELK